MHPWHITGSILVQTIVVVLLLFIVIILSLIAYCIIYVRVSRVYAMMDVMSNTSKQSSDASTTNNSVASNQSTIPSISSARLVLYIIVSVLVFPVGILLFVMWRKSDEPTHRTGAKAAGIAAIAGFVLACAVSVWAFMPNASKPAWLGGTAQSVVEPSGTPTPYEEPDEATQHELIKQSNTQDNAKSMFDLLAEPQGHDPINVVVQDMAATGTFVGHEQLTLSEATVSHNVVTVSLHMPQVSVEDAQTIANDFLNRIKPVLAGSPYDSAGSRGMQIIVTVVRDKTDADQWAGSTAKIVAVASADGSIE